MKKARRRATAVVMRDGKVLLVKERGQGRFSLPGGGVKRNEPVVAAAARELAEELGLEAIKVTRLPGSDFTGPLNQHLVCLVDIDGEPCLRQFRVNGFMWWDMRQSIPVLPHVLNILKKMDSQGLITATSSAGQGAGRCRFG